MAKKINNLTVIQLLDVKAFLDRQTEQGVKLDTIADLASVAEKVLGFTITTSNIQRVFREFDLDKSNYVKKYEGNSMMIQIAEMQKQAVEDEAEKMENMSSWKARILGVSKEDAI